MADVLAAVDGLVDERLKLKCQTSIGVVERCIDLYGLNGLAFSFNGGKDSTVILHIIRAAIEKHRRDHPGVVAGTMKDVHTFFFHNPADFDEVVEFTNVEARQYSLDLRILHGGFRQGLELLLKETAIKGIILGTRKGDPNAAEQEVFCPSSRGYPPFMRINPILHWSFHDVWAFLLAAKLGYCSLYDHGYTSLGEVTNTHLNPALRKEDGSYAPAYMLPDARLERVGREQAEQHLPTPLEDASTAGVIIVGDEILSAKVKDVNTRFLCRELHAEGWLVPRVVIVRDCVSEIAVEVRGMSSTYDAVIIAGGIGPTVDDVSMAALAEACDTCLHRHPEIESRIREFFGEHTTTSHLKMAQVPEGSETALIECRTDSGALSPWPVVRCRNVYALPGIPSLLQEKWPAVKEDMCHLGLDDKAPVGPYHCMAIRLATDDETQVAGVLERVVARHGRQVSLGSYQLVGQKDGAGIVLSVESKDFVAVRHATDELVQGIESTLVLSSGPASGRPLNESTPSPSRSPIRK